MTPNNHPNRHSGFSLVETVMAVGITATVIISLLALLPLGLETLQSASKRTSVARIKQAVVSNYKMLSWKEVEKQAGNGGSRDFFFDDRGAPVPSSNENILFGARVWVGDRVTLAGDDDENEYLRRLTIYITHLPEMEDAYVDPKKYQVAQATVSKVEK